MSGNEVLYVRTPKNNDPENSDGTSAAPANEDDPWDDSLLIEAYDKAISLAQAEVLRTLRNPANGRNAGKNKNKIQWNVGDQCRCEYSEDRTYYEANIIRIIDELEMCVVKYVGYENEETVLLSKLKRSKGETARSAQMKQAQEENGKRDELSADTGLGSDNPLHSSKKKNDTKNQGKPTAKENTLPNGAFVGSHFPSSPKVNVLAPPPPPEMFSQSDDDICENDALGSMLMSWYMSGYHTGYYQGLKAAKK